MEWLLALVVGSILGFLFNNWVVPITLSFAAVLIYQAWRWYKDQNHRLF